MHFKKMKTLLRVPAIALCAAIGIGHASAVQLNHLPATDAAAIGMISSNEQVAIGLVRTTEEMVRAREELAARQAAFQAASEAAQLEALKQAFPYVPTYGRTVSYSPVYSVDESITLNGSALGEFKLTFYCACSECSGHYGHNTASGTTCAEGRTIAVDPDIIPLGSRVYIEGFGDFIAEDTGGAIDENKIDIYLSDHDRCYEMGVTRANVYLMD